MASTGPTGTEAGPLRVGVVGSTDAVAGLDAADRLSPSAVDSVESAVAAVEAEDVDCVLAVLPLSHGELGALVDDVKSVADVPVVAVTGDPASPELFETGVDDIVARADDLPRWLEWIAGRDVAVDGTKESAASADTSLESLAAFGDGGFVLDRRWRFRSVNDRAATLLGYRADELEGERIWTRFPGLLGTGVRAEFGHVVRTGDPVTFEVQFPDRGRWVEVSARAAPGGILTRLRDVTERVEERRTRERYERILETINDGIYTLDADFTITHVNNAVTELTGYERDELIGAHSTLLADESVLVRASDAIQDILSGDRESGLLEAELERADGTTFPIETHFSAISYEDGSYGSVGVVRDITERKEYERTLTELNRSTNELFRAETKAEVAQLVVDTATDVLGLPGAAVYLYEETQGTLEPAAWHTADVPPPVTPGEDSIWRGFVEGESVSLDSSVESEWLRTAGTGQPLGEHGMLIETSDTGRDEGRMLTERQDVLVRLLQTNAVAALDRVDRRLELTRSERELALRNDELQRLNRLNELLRDVNRSLVEAETRDAIERAVCELLASAPSVAYAWIGEFDRNASVVEPVADAGEGAGYLDDPPSGSGSGDDEPSVIAARTGEPILVTNVAEGVQGRPWRQRALSRDFRSAVSVPLVYNEYVYGVLTLYASRAAEFDDETEEMFAELGRTIAYAISGVEAKESLVSQSVVELELEVPGPTALLTRLARKVGGELTLEGIIQPSAGGSRLYLTVRDPSKPIDAIEAVQDVTAVEFVAEDEEENEDGEAVFVEVTVEGATVADRFADLGVAIRTLVADGESIDAVVELQRGVDVRGFVEAIAESHPGTELRSRRSRERPVETRRAFQAAVEEDLTARQLEVLRTAFLSGYFQWPRTRSGVEIAASLDIAQSTFNRHLRVAERKLLSKLFEPV